MTQDMTDKPSGRIAWLDLARGIGILLVVWAHARAPFAAPIYHFHMPFFFLLSGFLYNERDSFWTFLRKRIVSLYLPFVFWNALAFLIRYATQYRPLDKDRLLEMLRLIFLTVGKDKYAFGATWFLGALFSIAVVYKLLDVLRKHLHVSVSWLILLSLALCGSAFVIPLPYMMNRTVVLGIFYIAGDLVRRFHNRYPDVRILYPGVSVLSFLLFTRITSVNYVNMGKNTYDSPVLFVIGALLMSYALCWFCWQMDQFRRPRIWNVCREGLILFGRRSIDLVIWQFVFFRPVTLVQSILWGLPVWETLLTNYAVNVTTGGWWLAYFLTGSILPLLFTDLLRWGPWGKILKKIHVV